jgi:rhodanese-related sulfurtransferase
MKKVLTLVTALAFVASLWAGEFPDISIKELKGAIESKKVTLIDVMGTKSWKNGHIPTAIDFATHRNDLANVLPKDKSALVVAYCTGPT